MNGSGERVCYIINDLLNRELIKQNFRFKEPIIGEDNDIEESKDENAIHDETVDQLLIDETKISRRKYFEICDAKGLEDELLKEPDQSNIFEDDDNEMIMPWVDPDDWYKEYNRVLKYIDKDIDAYGNIKESKDATHKKLIEVSDMDDFLDKIQKMIEYFKTITEFLEGDSRKQLEGMIDYWTKSNDKIKYFENKITNEVGPKFDNFKSENEGCTNLTQELTQRTDNIKVLIDNYDNISVQLQKIEKIYEKKSQEMFDQGKIAKLKEAIKKIKKEIASATIQEGMYRSEILKFQLKEGGSAFEMYNLINNHDADEQKEDSFDI